MYTAPGCVLLFNISLHINGQQQLCRVKKRLEALKKTHLYDFTPEGPGLVTPLCDSTTLPLRHPTAFLIWDRELWAVMV